MLKYSGNTINDWNYGASNIIKVYRNNAIVFYKVSGESPTPPTPTPSGQTPQYAVVPNIQSYTATTYDKVYDMVTSKWYMLNNLNQYEEYGLYDTTGSSLSDYTYYDGKLVAVDTTEYQYSGNTWVVVGTYEDASVTYTIDKKSAMSGEYVGQTLSTTFKIPTADIEGHGRLDMTIRTSDGGNLKIRTDEYNYNGNDLEQGTVTSDADYYYYSLPTTQSVVIRRIQYLKSNPIHLIAGSKQISVEYAELEEPYGAVLFSSMTEACNYADVYYGLAAHIANNNYVYTTANTWNSVSSQGNYFKLNALANTKYSFSYKASTGSLYVSYDFGNTWVNGSNMLKVQSGTTVMFKGDLTPTNNGIGTFSSTSNFTVEGNAMSLLYGDDFTSQTSLSGKNNAFMDLFSGCTTLTSAENLSLLATTLADRCYINMFYGCTNLTTAPELPATTLATWCYSNMFSSCTSLTTAPRLLATTLVDYCYSGMFNGCTSLSAITCLATDISAMECTNYWVNNVSTSGTFIKASSMSSWTTGPHGIPSGWTVQDATV